MPNVFKVADWVTMEVMRLLKNKLHVAQVFNTDYNAEFSREFAVGATINVKLPQAFKIRDGMGYTPQAINRRTTPVTIDQSFGVDFEWDSIEKALYLERSDAAIRKQYLEPAAAKLQNEIDKRAAAHAFLNCPNVVGAIGTNPTAFSTYLSAEQIMFDQSCPDGDKIMVIPPGANASIVGSTTTMALFNPSSEISRMYKQGTMGTNSGFDWYRSNNLYAHTCGTWANTLTVQTTPTNGATSVVVGGTAGETIKKGDKFKFSATYAVNPMSLNSVGRLKTFTATQTLTLTGGTTDTLYFYPAMYGPGSEYQNVDAYPVGASATITNWPGTTTPGTGPVDGVCGLALHRDAFALVSAKLENPKAVEIASQTRDPETGIWIAFVRAFDFSARKMGNRFDVCLGFGNLYAENCSVVVGADS